MVEQLERSESDLMGAISDCCSAPQWDALLKELTNVLDEVSSLNPILLACP